jgi:hypothetical protein
MEDYLYNTNICGKVKSFGSCCIQRDLNRWLLIYVRRVGKGNKCVVCMFSVPGLVGTGSFLILTTVHFAEELSSAKSLVQVHLPCRWGNEIWEYLQNSCLAPCLSFSSLLYTVLGHIIICCFLYLSDRDLPMD